MVYILFMLIAIAVCFFVTEQGLTYRGVQVILFLFSATLISAQENSYKFSYPHFDRKNIKRNGWRTKMIHPRPFQSYSSMTCDAIVKGKKPKKSKNLNGYFELYFHIKTNYFGGYVGELSNGVFHGKGVYREQIPYRSKYTVLDGMFKNGVFVSGKKYTETEDGHILEYWIAENFDKHFRMTGIGEYYDSKEYEEATTTNGSYVNGVKTGWFEVSNKSFHRLLLYDDKGKLMQERRKDKEGNIAYITYVDKPIALKYRGYYNEVIQEFHKVKLITKEGIELLADEACVDCARNVNELCFYPLGQMKIKLEDGKWYYGKSTRYIKDPIRSGGLLNYVIHDIKDNKINLYKLEQKTDIDYDHRDSRAILNPRLVFTKKKYNLTTDDLIIAMEKFGNEIKKKHKADPAWMSQKYKFHNRIETSDLVDMYEFNYDHIRSNDYFKSEKTYTYKMAFNKLNGEFIDCVNCKFKKRRNAGEIILTHFVKTVERTIEAIQSLSYEEKLEYQRKRKVLQDEIQIIDNDLNWDRYGTGILTIKIGEKEVEKVIVSFNSGSSKPYSTRYNALTYSNYKTLDEMKKEIKKAAVNFYLAFPL